MTGGWGVTLRDTTAYARAQRLGSLDPWCRHGSNVQWAMDDSCISCTLEVPGEEEEGWSLGGCLYKGKFEGFFEGCKTPTNIAVTRI